MGFETLILGLLGMANTAIDDSVRRKTKREYIAKYGKKRGFQEWLLRNDSMYSRITKKKLWGVTLSEEEREYERRWNKLHENDNVCPTCGAAHQPRHCCIWCGTEWVTKDGIRTIVYGPKPEWKDKINKAMD